MTAQEGDLLVYAGSQCPLESYPKSKDDLSLPHCFLPLEALWEQEGHRPRFVVHRTSLWRGYVATWQIEDHSLYLTKLEARVVAQDGRSVRMIGDPMERTLASSREDDLPTTEATLDLIGTVENGRVFASWFSGRFTIPFGDMMSTSADEPEDWSSWMTKLTAQTDQPEDWSSFVRTEARGMRRDRVAFTVQRGCVTDVAVWRDWLPQHLEKRWLAIGTRREELDTTLAATPDEKGWITCPHCGWRTAAVSLKNGRHPRCQGRVTLSEP